MERLSNEYSNLRTFIFLFTHYPKSVVRVQSDFVLPACRLAVSFVEGVAGHVETKRQTRCRWQGESTLESLKSYKNIFLAV